MTKNYKLIFIFMICFILMGFFCYMRSTNAIEVSLMEQYPQERWLNSGAKIFFDKSNNEVLIKKDQLTPAWGGVILEIGTIDISKDSYLKFNVVNLKGQYAVAVHFGGPEQYETHLVKVQEDTTILGSQEYNVSEALRMQGLSGEQQIAIQILVIDPQGEPEQGMVRLKELSFGSRE